MVCEPKRYFIRRRREYAAEYWESYIHATIDCAQEASSVICFKHTTLVREDYICTRYYNTTEYGIFRIRIYPPCFILIFIIILQYKDRATTGASFGNLADNPTDASAAWRECANKFRKYDKSMVQGWKEEIDTLLVFVNRMLQPITLVIAYGLLGWSFLGRGHCFQYRSVQTFTGGSSRHDSDPSLPNSHPTRRKYQCYQHSKVVAGCSVLEKAQCLVVCIPRLLSCRGLHRHTCETMASRIYERRC